MKKLMMICLLLAIPVAAMAQRHNMSPGWCKYVKNLKGTARDESASAQCQACIKEDEKERAAKAAEEKRNYEASVIKTQQMRAAAIAAKKKLDQEVAARYKVTEVFVTMPKTSSASSSSSSASSVSNSSEENSSTSTSSTNETSSETNTSSSNVTIYNNAFAAEAYKKQQQEKLIADGAKLMNDFFDNWQANREKRWAREKQESERFSEKVDLDRKAYNTFVMSQEKKLFNSSTNYYGMLHSMMPKVLRGNIMTWEDILGSPDHNNVFGKDVKSVARKLKAILPKDRLKNKLETVEADKLPKQFTKQSFYKIHADKTFFYWVNNDFYEHNPTYIVDSKDVLVGIEIELHTSSRENESFPSTLQEYISLKSYYDGILKGTGGNYFFADGKTLVTRDKVYILDFQSLTVYDLNYFEANTSFNLPAYFGVHDLRKLGFKFEGFRENDAKKQAGVRVTEVDKNSAAEKGGLMPGDIILNLNDVLIDFPFHLEWYFLAFPEERNFNFKIERAKKIETISIKL